MASERLQHLLNRLGLTPERAPIADAVDALELADDEWARLAGVMNVELQRIYAERHLGATAHRVPHALQKSSERVESWQPGNDGQPELGHVTRPIWSARLHACPDCGRTLVAVRDMDSAVPLLVCHRLHGLAVATLLGDAAAALTPYDVVACGLKH